MTSMALGPIEAVRLFTRSMERAGAFYADTLGLTPIVRDEAFAVFETGQAKLVLECCDPDDPEADALVGRFAGISFTVPDIAASVDALRAKGVITEGPPERQDWGGVLAHVRDPDGNVLTLVQYPS